MSKRVKDILRRVASPQEETPGQLLNVKGRQFYLKDKFWQHQGPDIDFSPDETLEALMAAYFEKRRDRGPNERGSKYYPSRSERAAKQADSRLRYKLTKRSDIHAARQQAEDAGIRPAMVHIP